MITRLTTFHVALLLGCSPPTALQLAADDDAHQTPAGTPRTVGALADELFALIDSTPELDAYGRHLVTMAGEQRALPKRGVLERVVRVRDPQRLRHRLEVVRGHRRRGERAVVFQSHQERLPVARAEGSPS